MIDRRRALASALLLPLVANASAAKPRRDPRNPMLGTWSLLSANTVMKDGTTTPWNGKPGPYKGLIMYQADGKMAVQIALPRSAIAEGIDFAKLPADQRLAYLDSYYAYYGRFEFDPAASIVHHYVESALDPSEIGVHYRRKVALEGDVVTLATIPNETDPKSHNVLKWRRV